MRTSMPALTEDRVVFALIYLVGAIVFAIAFHWMMAR